jgi:hypothetical protein
MQENKKTEGRVGTKWQEQSTEVRSALQDEHPDICFQKSWTEDHQLRGVRRTSRVEDLIDLGSLHLTASDLKPNGLFMDTSLSHSRCSKAYWFHWPYLTRNCDVYSYEKDRACIAEEIGSFLCLNAPPVQETFLKGAAVISDLDLRELLANSMNLAHVSTVILSIVLCATEVFPPSPTEDPETHADEK